MGDLATNIDNQSGLLSVIEKVALDPNVDVNKMTQIVDLQERIFDKNVEIAFSKAMSECQKEMPAIARDAVNQQTNSTYARFETILTTVKPCYTKHGFSLSFGTDQSPVEQHIRITCDVMHREGHAKHYFVDLPLDNTGIKGTVNKTGIHGTGSTYSYGKRYLLTMIFNIAIANQDDDAVKAGGVTIENLLDYLAVARQYVSSIAAIKEYLINNDLDNAAQEWFTLDDQAKTDLWRAPSKGGLFTTLEREIMKSKEFKDAFYGSGGDEQR